MASSRTAGRLGPPRPPRPGPGGAGLFEPAREDFKRARSLAADPVREWFEHQADADWFAKNWPMASFELGTLIEVYGG